MKATILKSRGIVRVSGSDAGEWLQNLITNDIAKAGEGRACFAALLSPQGKILFDFLISPAESDFLLDCAGDQAPALTKRLNMYKLRAKISVSDESSALSVLAIWDSPQSPVAGAVRDPRAAGLGWRIIVPAAEAENTIPLNANAEDYEKLRVGAGVPKGGQDFDWGDIFPHDANMDELDGVDFKKGCYIGQEVVSRVQHRGTARKRFRPLTLKGSPVETGTEISSAETVVGTITSAVGGLGLGLIRIDKIGENTGSLSAGGTIVEIRDI